MATEFWKRLERNHSYRLAKTRLRQWLNVIPSVDTDLIIDTVSEGGWTYCPQLLNRESIVYSFGVGDDISFDLSLIQRTGATVFAFDPTVVLADLNSRFDIPSSFHFYAWAAACEDGEMILYPRVEHGRVSKTMYTLMENAHVKTQARQVPARTIKSIANEFEHQKIDLIKIDIEGAEYGVIEDLLKSHLRPTQILIEFHHRHAGFSKHDTLNCIQEMRKAGYKIFSCSDLIREIAFMHESQHL